MRSLIGRSLLRTRYKTETNVVTFVVRNYSNLCGRGSADQETTWCWPEGPIFPIPEGLKSYFYHTKGYYMINYIWFIEQTQYHGVNSMKLKTFRLLPIVPMLYDSFRSIPYMLRSPKSSKIKISSDFVLKPTKFLNMDQSDIRFQDLSWMFVTSVLTFQTV